MRRPFLPPLLLGRPSPQMLIGGKGRAIQFGPDDYIFAAINIFLDIIK